MRLQVMGKRLLLANVEGQFFLVQEMCSHEDVSLYLGCLQGKTLKCSLHGSRFDLSTGQPLDEPADEPLQIYPVRVENGQIFLSST